MKKVKFQRSGLAGKGMYIALCIGLLAVGVASAVGYKAVVGSLTSDIIPNSGIELTPDIDTSQVDSILSGVQKDDESADSKNGQDVSEQQVNGSTENVSDELQTPYYEQAKMYPVQGEVINEYSWGELVKTTGGVWRTHDGIDIAAQEGEAVKAMTSGSVTDIYSDTLWGNCVVVDHGDTLTGYYYGLSPDIKVTVGESVSAGTVIGTVGNTADIESDMDSHLHFALKYEGMWIDPVSYIEPMK